MHEFVYVASYIQTNLTTPVHQLKKSDKKFLRETKILPESFTFNSEIYIYDNKICLIDLKKDIIGVIIESSELYNIHKQIFDMLWNVN